MNDDHRPQDVRSDDSTPVSLKTVREEERKAIAVRRERAEYKSPPQNDLVGVALSGGGLRSAMFNLGLLQALQESGFMKYVDYLSTVSGGGYIGGFYSAVGHNFSADSADSGHKTTDAGSKVEKEKSDSRRYVPELYRATHRFINAGQYLNQPWAFFAGYLIPSLFVFLLFFSGLVMTMSLIALFLRCFDLPIVNDHLVLLNLDSEVSALCVAIFSLWFVFLLIYFSIRMAIRERRGPEQSSGAKYGPLLKLFVIAVFCGVAIMLGNYDFGLMSGASIQFQKRDAQTPIIIVAALGLLALFRLPLLLRSEQQSASAWQKAILWTILTVTVGGGSLAVLSLVGAEGVSGYATQRGPRLDHEDIVDNRAFGLWLTDWLAKSKDWLAKAKVNPDFKPEDRARFAAREKIVEVFIGEAEKFTKAVKALDKEKQDLFPDDIAWRGNPESMLHLDDLGRSLRYFSRFLESREHPITKYLSDQNAVRKSRNGLIDLLNRNLFYQFGNEQKVQPWHLWDHDATHGQLQADIQGYRTDQLLASFSNRTQLHTGSATRSPQTAAEALIAVASAIVAPNGLTVVSGEMVKPSKLNDVHNGIVDYLKLATNHANKPLLETDAFLKTLTPMIQPDGSLKYTEDALDPSKELAFRRQLLEMTDPHVFKQKAFISTPVVVAKDQAARLWIFLLAAISFSILCLLVDFNKHAAVFEFYRERIARTFIEAGSRNRSKADMPLSQFAPWEKGFPYPLIVAALKLPESVDINRHKAHELDRNPAKVDGSVGSEWYSFLLSPKYVGYMPAGSGTTDSQTSQSTLRTYRSTETYLNNELKVTDAVTLSGAAFTPWMANNSALNLLMHVFNLRLEQWLPNPSSSACLDGKQPMKLWNIIRECIRCSTSDGLKRWQRGIVADGGFREFLGVEELIARRCRIIVVSDAGCNNGLSEFGVLADLVRQLRLDHDVRILDLDHDLPLDTQRMQRTRDGQGVQHFIAGRIRYPETDGTKDESLYHRTGLFVYVQMSLTGDEDIDLAQFQKLHPTFPDEPITNQFFSADQVESLRQLGHHVGRHLCQRFDPERIEAPPHRTKKPAADRELTDPQEQDVVATVNGSSPSESSSKPKEAIEKQTQLTGEIRVERLADALVGAYLVECRQEQHIGKDDTPPDQPVIDGALDPAATEAFREYEEQGRGQPLSHFVTYVVDGYSSDDNPGVLNVFDAILPLAKEIAPEELTGLAVECNRRHVGFRSENPDRFFRIGGRQLLLRSTSRAIRLCHELLPGIETSLDPEKVSQASSTPGNDHSPPVADSDNDDKQKEMQKLFDDNLPKLLVAVAQLAATLPDGIFRSHGVVTSRDLTLCVLSWIASIGGGNQFGSLHSRLHEQIHRAHFRRGLKRAIRTRLAAEVHDFLMSHLVTPDVRVSSSKSPAPALPAHLRKTAPAKKTRKKQPPRYEEASDLPPSPESASGDGLSSA